MNPLLSQFLSAVLRWVLTGAGAWFVQKGILNAGEVDDLIAGAIIAILALAWSLYSKYKSKVELFTIAAMPKGTSLEEAKQSIASGVQASAGTGAGDTPVLVNSNMADSVKPRGNSWLLPLLLTSSLLAGSVAVTSCAGSIKPPVITGENQEQVRAAATKVLAGIEVAGVVVRDGRQMVSDLAGAGIVSADVRSQVNQAVIAANDIVQRVITEIASTTRLVTVQALALQASAAMLRVAEVLEHQTDTRVQTAGRFLRTAIGAVSALAGGVR